MGKNLSPVLRRELANLDKDAESRRSAMKALKSYVKDLDSKTIPHFLAQVSETKEPGSYSGEYTISLYEVLARVHGRNIVPQIDNIVSTIIRTLSSSAGSFPLHQACSKVVPAIARYGIDPSTLDDEKARIICSLCKPLAHALMSSQESTASGAALCLKALVESDNWRFASDEMVNEVCLKVAGAMEGKLTHTNSHMGLVMALAKHNGLVIEVYARSLLRSGLQILTAGISENNSQKRFSAIQMINFLMKCVDSRSIATELDSIIDAMEKCQGDHMPFVRGAAFEALQTAKLILIQKGAKYGISSSPFIGSNSKMINGRKNSPAGFASPESQTVDSFLEYDAPIDSPLSTGQSSCNFEYVRRANRRLWNDGTNGIDISLKDGLFIRACSQIDALNGDGEPTDTCGEHSEAFSGFVPASTPNSVRQDIASSPQRFQPQLTVDDIKIYPTPRKLIRSLQEPVDAKSDGLRKLNTRALLSPSLSEVATKTLNEESHSHSLHSRIEGRKRIASITLNKQGIVQNADLVPDGTESVSSTEDIPDDSAPVVLCRAQCEDENRIPMGTIMKGLTHNKAGLSFVCVIFLIFLSIALSTIWFDNDEPLFVLVPT